MFEKEAEEYLYDRLDPKAIDSVSEFSNKHIEEAIVSSFKKGAEFGYNKASEDFAKQLKEVVETCNHWQEVAEKANEWHYVKDGDLPKEIKEYLVYKIDGYGCKSIQVMQFNNQHCWCANCQNEIKAWKEIVLPELKESE